MTDHTGPTPPISMSTAATLGPSDEEIVRLRATIERERTWSCEWINRVRAEIRKRRGISQSRGSYEWNDDAYMKEFGAALDAIEAALDKATRDTHARDLSDCPTTQAEVEAARAVRSPTHSAPDVTRLNYPVPRDQWTEAERRQADDIESGRIFQRGAPDVTREGNENAASSAGTSPETLPTQEQFNEAVGILAQAHYNAERVQAATWLRDAYSEVLRLAAPQRAPEVAAVAAHPLTVVVMPQSEVIRDTIRRVLFAELSHIISERDRLEAVAKLTADALVKEHLAACAPEVTPTLRPWNELNDEEKAARLLERPKYEEDMHPSGSTARGGTPVKAALPTDDLSAVRPIPRSTPVTPTLDELTELVRQFGNASYCFGGVRGDDEQYVAHDKAELQTRTALLTRIATLIKERDHYLSAWSEGFEDWKDERARVEELEAASRREGTRDADEIDRLRAEAGDARWVVEKHRRHVELSPGVGAEVQRYALAVLDDVLADLERRTKPTDSAPGGEK